MNFYCMLACTREVWSLLRPANKKLDSKLAAENLASKKCAEAQEDI